MRSARRGVATILVFSISLTIAAAQQFKLSDFGVELSFTADADIFPMTWLTPEVNGKAVSLDTSEMERSERIIVKALNKYPVELIRKNLLKIYVVRRLEFYGQSYGGTNSAEVLYLSNDGLANGYSDFWIEQAFHSEFSSILFRNFYFLFSEKRWKALNDGITYGPSGLDALKQSKASKVFDADLARRGVLSQYGTASVEEDFNLFAENLFFSSPGFWTLVKDEKRIRKKTDEVIRMYNRIDPMFTESYFREISRQ